MFEPVTRNIYRWTVTDPEFGEQMVGHLLMKGESMVLVDPPATPRLIESLKVLGKVEAVIMTTYSHRRGCAHISAALGSQLLIPDFRETGIEHTEETLKKLGLGSGKKYGEETELPLGIKPHLLMAELGPNRLALGEMTLEFGEFIIVGDAAWEQDGKLNIFPTGIMADEGGKKASSIASELWSIVQKTCSSGLLAGHGEDLRSGLQELLKVHVK